MMKVQFQPSSLNSNLIILLVSSVHISRYPIGCSIDRSYGKMNKICLP